MQVYEANYMGIMTPDLQARPGAGLHDDPRYCSANVLDVIQFIF